MKSAQPIFAFAFAFVFAGASAQHHDPWAGSGCTCDTFCNKTCAINATTAQNVTLYRMTPFGAWDMNNKDTGDAHGDTSFVLSRKTAAYECRKDPNSFMCSSVTQFTGDDPNSTDVVQEFKIEIDGQWGPYLYCNPVNISRSTGAWACTVDISPGGSPPPPQCKAAGFKVYSDYCITGAKNTSVADEGACCAAAEAAKARHFTFYKDDGVCALSSSYFPHFEHCQGGATGVKDSPSGHVCNCSRVHETVGRENLTVAMSGRGGHSQHPAGGLWLSHPTQGRCTGTQRVGDGSGCTWRVIERTRAVKASCMYQRLDAGVESTQPACFAACGPRNVTSDCYLKCFSEAVYAMTQDQLVAPWLNAFGSSDPSKGGCPDTPDNWF